MVIYMGFLDKIFTPKYKHEDSKIRLESVEKLSDQKILLNIAKNDEDWSVRKAAVEKINDENFLIDIAKNDEWAVSSKSIEKINNENFLIDISKNARDKSAREKATLKYKNKHIDEIFNSSNFYNDSLKEFERNNCVTFSIYDLENHDILMCDNSRNIYTIWNNENIYFKNGYLSGSSIKSRPVIDREYNSIRYISEDFSNKNHVEKRKYQYVSKRISIENVQDPATDYWVDSITTNSKFSRLEAIVIIGITDKITNLSEMFYGCQAETISFVNCDFSNVKNTYAIFSGCNNLKTIHADETSILSLIMHVPESKKYLDMIPKFSESELLDMMDDKSITSRKFAIERINDEKILTEILQNDESPEVRLEAIKRINDEKILTEILQNDESHEVRLEAIKRINDEKILTEILQNDESPEVRLEAIKRINDEKILTEILQNDESHEVRLEAIKKINQSDSDENVNLLATKELEKILSNNGVSEVKKEHIKLINDETILIEILKNNKSSEVRREAIKKINNENILVQFVNADSDEDVRVFAIRKINNKSILMDIANNNSSLFIREEAEKRLRKIN